jgi:hypothetical protein
MPLAGWRLRLRSAAKALLRTGPDPAAHRFHVALAPHRLTALGGELAALGDAAPSQPLQRDPGEPWGYMPGHDKALSLPTLLGAGIRSDLPFRDPRLLHLFAGFPASYLIDRGLNRAPARIMMAGRLPKAIRLRRTVGPFSPDYMERIRQQAAEALTRLPVFRQAGADDWLDLTWLEARLKAVSARGAASIGDAFEVQLTAMAAEFLVWWHRAE